LDAASMSAVNANEGVKAVMRDSHRQKRAF